MSFDRWVHATLAAACLLCLAAGATAQVRIPRDDDESISIPQPTEPVTPIPMPDADLIPMPDEQQAAAIALRMETPRDYPAAGLQLALPVGFRRQPLVDPYQVVLAARNEGMHTALGLSVSAFPVREGIQPEQIVQNFLDELATNIAIRRLDIQPSTTVQLAGQQAVARRMNYKFRGVRTTGLVACLVRSFENADPPTPPSSIAYLLTFEVLEKYAGSLDDFVAQIGRDMKFIPFRSPTTLKIDGTGAFVRDFPNGYAIRQPAGWSVEFNDLGVAMGRMNYLLGDVVSPNLQVTAREVAATETGCSLGEKTIDFERKQGWEIDILSEGKIKLAGREAWQIVLRKKMGAAATQPSDDDAADSPEQPSEPTTQTAPQKPDADKTLLDATTLAGTSSIEVRRLMCMPAGDDKPGRQRHFAIILTCHDCSPDRVVEMMDTLADGFALLRQEELHQDPTNINMPTEVDKPIPMPR